MELSQSALESARAIRSGIVSSAELVDASLARISMVNPAINAVVALAAEAEEKAREADRALARGHPSGPLHGVPMTIKDCFDTRGLTSTWGTAGRRDFLPQTSATVVRRLEAAGAILLGKTNTSELTLSFETYNDLHGFTHNPYRLSHSPGGSSGGAAALLAAAGTAFDIGTDHGGSIRLPSHCCGTAGIKPTAGRVPRTGLCLPPGMLGDALSHVGPMARHVEDLVTLLAIIQGPDGRDSNVVPVPLGNPLSVDLRALRCGVVLDNGVITPDAESIAAVEAVARALEPALGSMTGTRLPTAIEDPPTWQALWAGGLHAAMRAQLEAAGTSPADCSVAWFVEMDRTLAGRLEPQAAAAALLRLARLRRDTLEFMDHYDVLLLPVNARPAQPHPAPRQSPFPDEWASYTSLFNLTGYPAGVVRAGTTAEGLPIGVQVVAAPWRDDVVLALLAEIERRMGTFPGPALQPETKLRPGSG